MHLSNNSRYTLFAFCWIILTCVWSPMVNAAPKTLLDNKTCAELEGKIDFAECVDEGDLSKYYLGIIFGDVGTLLDGERNGSSSDLMARLFRVFNIIVLSLGTIIVVYTTIASTINTAQEGEMMGKKWSSVWIPIRSVLGVACLLPLGKGYSLIQMLVLWVVLQGIGAANAMWGTLLDYVLVQGNSINQPSMLYIPNLEYSLKALLKASICMETINNNSIYANAVGGFVEIYFTGTGYNIGVPGSSTYQKVCGSISLPTTQQTSIFVDVASGSDDTSEPITDDSSTVELSIAIYKIFAYLQSAAQEAVLSLPDGWALSGGMSTAETQYTDIIAQIIQNKIAASGFTVSTKIRDMLDKAKKDGWITAGSYYYKLIRARNVINDAGLRMPPGTTEGQVGLWSSEVTYFYNQYEPFFTNSSSEPRHDIGLGPSNDIKGEGRQLFDETFGKVFMELVLAMVNQLSFRDPDPMVSLQKFGTDLIITVEILWFTGLIIIFAALLLAYAAWPGLQGFGWALTGLLNMMMPVVGVVMAFLWGSGVAMGIYLPLVPYIVFTLAALSWLMMVLEAVVAAPIVALGLTVPSNDHLGKAASGILLITGVFLRPTLMIIGFVAASRVYIAIMALVHFSIGGVLKSQMTGIGLFGALALIGLYGGVAVAIAHECFTLIYILPDRVLRWIGGQAEQSSVAHAEREARQASEKGSRTSGEMGKDAAMQLAKKSQNMHQKMGEKMGKAHVSLSQSTDQSSGGKKSSGGESPPKKETTKEPASEKSDTKESKKEAPKSSDKK